MTQGCSARDTAIGLADVRYFPRLRQGPGRRLRVFCRDHEDPYPGLPVPGLQAVEEASQMGLFGAAGSTVTGTATQATEISGH